MLQISKCLFPQQVSCIKSGLLPVSPEAVELLPNVRYHDYAGIVTDATEADAIRSDLGNAKILFLRNKGVTVAASTIPEAWYLMKRVISACQTQVCPPIRCYHYSAVFMGIYLLIACLTFLHAKVIIICFQRYCR